MTDKQLYEQIGIAVCMSSNFLNSKQNPPTSTTKKAYRKMQIEFMFHLAGHGYSAKEIAKVYSIRAKTVWNIFHSERKKLYNERLKKRI